MSKTPRIGLIHALFHSIEPIKAAFATGWPDVEITHLLDDSLSRDRAREADLSEATRQRILDLASYSRRNGADAILFTCSAFGPAIEQAARDLPVPVLKPNEAMFEAALGYGDRIGMIATFQPSVGTMREEFAEEAQRRRPGAALTALVRPEAMAALNRGDAASHNALVAAAAPELADVAAIMLAQFSTAQAAAAVRQQVSVPVLTSPDAAVAKLRRLFGYGVTA